MSFTHRVCADLLNLDWLSRCWEEPNNHCCSRTVLCGEGLQDEDRGQTTSVSKCLFMKSLGSNLRHTHTLFYIKSHVSECDTYWISNFQIWQAKEYNFTTSQTNANWFTNSFLESHHSSSCRWISSDLLQCSRGGRGWTSQTVGRGTSGSPCLRENKKQRAGWRTNLRRN